MDDIVCKKCTKEIKKIKFKYGGKTYIRQPYAIICGLIFCEECAPKVTVFKSENKTDFIEPLENESVSWEYRETGSVPRVTEKEYNEMGLMKKLLYDQDLRNKYLEKDGKTFKEIKEKPKKLNRKSNKKKPKKIKTANELDMTKLLKQANKLVKTTKKFLNDTKQKES